MTFSVTKSLEQSQKNEELQSMLADRVSDWKQIHGMPIYWFGDYYPYYRFRDHELTRQQSDFRDFLITFKGNYERGTSVINHHRAMRAVAESLQTFLINVFGDLTRELTLVCAYASTQKTYVRRFGEFSDLVCKGVSMTNAMPYIKYLSDGQPKHMKGDKAPSLESDDDFFRNRNVILFDDLVTSGTTISLVRQWMENSGAHVIAAISLGRTV